jgi:hypothetical protein
VFSVRFERLSRPLAILFPFAAVAGIGLPYLIDRDPFAILAIYLAIPLFISAVYYFVIRHPGTLQEFARASRVPFKPLVTGYAVCQAVAILLLTVSPVRPRAYFVAIALAATLVLVQILRTELTPTRAGIILVECGAIVANVIGSVTFKYHFFFGRTDLFPHEWFARQLLQTNYVTPAFLTYESFPLWHILAATLRYYSGWDVAPRYFFFIASTAAYVALVGGMYVLSRRLFGSRRVALTAALMTSINTWVLFNGLYSIPRSIVSVLCVFVIITMLDESYRSYLLFVFLTIGIVVYHTVSVPFFLVTIGTVYLVQNVFAPGWVDSPVKMRDILTVVVIQAAYYLFAAREMLEIVRRRLVAPSISGSSGTGGTGADIPYAVNELANYLQFSLLLLFVAVAMLVGLRSERVSWTGKVVVVSGALLSVISFPGPVLLIGKFASNFNILRFSQYTFPFVVMAAAVGVVLLADADIRFRTPRATTVFRGVTLVLVLSLAFLAVSNDFVASDNPTVEREFYTYYLSESETEGLLTVSQLSGGNLLLDDVGCKYVINSPYDGDCTILQADPDRGILLTENASDLVVVRTTELENRGLQVLLTDEFSRSSYLYAESYVSDESPVWDDLDGRSKVYVTDDVAGYTVAGAANNSTALVGPPS